uniref:Transmembrane protein 14A n=1 Tax=Vombatus ursinus TaxID=29139 RepID=A0A4X2KJE5_VOMUR
MVGCAGAWERTVGTRLPVEMERARDVPQTEPWPRRLGFRPRPLPEAPASAAGQTLHPSPFRGRGRDWTGTTEGRRGRREGERACAETGEELQEKGRRKGEGECRGYWRRDRLQSARRITMTIDWIGFGYASIIASGGFLGYHRKGSIVSLVAGLFFGLLAGYGAYRISRDPRDVKMSLFTTFLLATIMGVRFKRSKKLMPAGIVAGLRSREKMLLFILCF